jgi:DUF2892 family protein
MYRNQSKSDRIFRVAVGLILLSLAVVGPQTPWGLIGAIPLLTGVMGFDPVYRILGLNTQRISLQGVSTTT